MMVALGIVAVACNIILVLPATSGMIGPIVCLLVLVALATFLGKSVILAPIGELELPEEIDGSGHGGRLPSGPTPPSCGATTSTVVSLTATSPTRPRDIGSSS